MFHRKRRIISGRCLLGAIFGLSLALLPWAGADGQGPGDPNLAKAALKGKYSQLLRKLFVPKDVNDYTAFCDWGFSSVTTYDKYDNLPPKSYWVYIAPYWYIWAHQDSSHDRTMEIASVNGKYNGLLRRVPMSTDLKQIGKFNDYGFSAARDYGPNKNLPAGYWVYVFPHWYIWAEKGEPLQGPQAQASANFKYVKLLRKIEVPKDQVYYGDYYDEGYQDQPVYAQYKNLPPGYWVYVAPNWYIWGKLRNTAVPLR